MSEIILENAQINSIKNTELKEMHYIGVMFESEYDTHKDNPKSYHKIYEYKTMKPLKEGEVITIETPHGQSRVCVMKENIPEDELEYFDIDSIKEI